MERGPGCLCLGTGDTDSTLVGSGWVPSSQVSALLFGGWTVWGAGQESCRLRDTVELEVCCGPGGAGVLTPQQVLAGQTRWVDQGSV